MLTSHTAHLIRSRGLSSMKLTSAPISAIMMSWTRSHKVAWERILLFRENLSDVSSTRLADPLFLEDFLEVYYFRSFFDCALAQYRQSLSNNQIFFGLRTGSRQTGRRSCCLRLLLLITIFRTVAVIIDLIGLKWRCFNVEDLQKFGDIFLEKFVRLGVERNGFFEMSMWDVLKLVPRSFTCPST